MNNSLTNRRDSIDSVQVMRGIAAIAVVLYHTDLILSQYLIPVPAYIADSASKGWVGVNFFFVLSGFIILLAHQSHIGEPNFIRFFLWRRFIRIYPTYWIFTAGYLTAAFLGFGQGDLINFNFDNLIESTVLTDLFGHPALPLKVAWTLIYEVRFYVIFCAFLVSLRVGFAVFIFWVLGIIWHNVSFSPGHGVLSIWNFYFFFGMSACWLLPRLPSYLAFPIFLAGSSILIAVLSTINVRIGEGQHDMALLIALAFAFTMILLGGALREKQIEMHFPRWMLLLGDASYSIYLVHAAAISLLGVIIRKAIPSPSESTALFVLTFLVAVTCGVFAHLMVEKPVLNWLRGLGKPGSQHPEKDTKPILSQGSQSNS